LPVDRSVRQRTVATDRPGALMSSPAEVGLSPQQTRGYFEMTANLKLQIELRHLTDTEIDAVSGGHKKGNDPVPKLPDDPVWTPIKILGGVLWWL
jgi:hypothetical protein